MRDNRSAPQGQMDPTCTRLEFRSSGAVFVLSCAEKFKPLYLIHPLQSTGWTCATDQSSFILQRACQILHHKAEASATNHQDELPVVQQAWHVQPCKKERSSHKIGRRLRLAPMTFFTHLPGTNLIHDEVEQFEQQTKDFLLFENRRQ